MKKEPEPALEDVLARIEELLIDLPEETDDLAGLIRERLMEARFYLLGSMPDEYSLELKLAGQLLPEMRDGDLKTRIAAFLKSQHGVSHVLHAAR